MIREVKSEEAEAFLAMQCQLDQETKYMMYEPGERKQDADYTREMIEAFKAEDSLLLVAEEEGKIVGFIAAERSKFIRLRHQAYIVVGILKAYRGKGIGTSFFEKLEKWREIRGLTRLELTVLCPNQQAFHLYKKMGFKVEGIKKKSMMIDGEYVDEYYMAKIYEEEK